MKKVFAYLQQWNLFSRKKTTKGFSLPEILTVTALIAVLSGIAVPSYIRYKKRSYETWVVNELSVISRFLHLARGVDGGFHQYLGPLGYRPQGKTFGNAGFRTDYHNKTPCCSSLYPKKPDDTTLTDSEYAHFSYIRKVPSGYAYNFSTTYDLCGANSTNCVQPSEKHNIRGFATLGVSAGSCTLSPTEAECTCNSFTIIGGTRYGQPAPRDNMKISDGVGIFVLNQAGQLCKADETGAFQAY